MRLFSFYPQESDVGETYSLVPATLLLIITDVHVLLAVPDLKIKSVFFVKSSSYEASGKNCGPLQGQVDRPPGACEMGRCMSRPRK
jgi:hypothetical protein